VNINAMFSWRPQFFTRSSNPLLDHKITPKTWYLSN